MITGVAAADTTILALAGTLTAPGKMSYATGTDTVSEVDSTSFGRSVLNAANADALAILTGLTARGLAQYDVHRFGAVGDDTADDTAAFQAAIDAFPNPVIYAPRGTYKLTETLTCTNKSLTIIGSSMTGSRLRWAGAAGLNGLQFVATTHQPTLHIEGVALQFLASPGSRTLGGTAVDARWPTTFLTGSGDTLSLHRSYVGSVPTANLSDCFGGWAQQVYARNPSQLQCHGSTFNSQGTQRLGVRLFTVNADTSNPNVFFFSGNSFIGALNGLQFSGNVSLGGVSFRDNSWVGMSRCLDVEVASDLVQVFGNYMQCSESGMYINARHPMIGDNRIDLSGIGIYTLPAVATGILIGSSFSALDGGIVRDNIFYSESHTGHKDAIVINDAISGAIIEGNKFGAGGDTFRRGIWFKSGSVNNVVGHNKWTNVTERVKDDNATSTNVVLSSGGHCIVTLAANQGSVADGTWTKVLYDTIVKNTDTLWDATNKRITPGVGKRVRLFFSAYLTTNTQADVVTSCAWRKNGSNTRQGTPLFSSIAGGTIVQAECTVVGNGTDYYEPFIFADTTVSTTGTIDATTDTTWVEAYEF